MIDKIIAGLTENGNRHSKNLETVKSQLDAIRSTHDSLQEFVFQSLLNVRNSESTQEKLELAVSTLMEIRKYSSQEIERYSSTLSLLSGKIENIQETIGLVSELMTESDDEEENEDFEEVDSAQISL